MNLTRRFLLGKPFSARLDCYLLPLQWLPSPRLGYKVRSWPSQGRVTICSGVSWRNPEEGSSSRENSLKQGTRMSMEDFLPLLSLNSSTERLLTTVMLKKAFSSVQFSRSVVSSSLRPRESRHARPPCPSPTPGVHSDSHPLSQWCHPAISSSVIPFSSCPQSLPASESFPMSQFFAWGGQSTGASALASFLPKKSQGWSPSEWTGWISLQSKELSRVSPVQGTLKSLSNTTVQKHQFFGA